MNVYADHAATTPMRPCAKEAMLEAMEEYGNPSSIHSAGRLAAMKMESARKEMAELLNCRPSEIYFTSGGTEADNWAIRAAKCGDGRVVASAFEHHAIIHTLEDMEREKIRRMELVKPEKDGIVDPEKVRQAADQYTNMVTIMAANNEVGTIQPIEEIGREIRKAGGKRTVFHTDAVQAVGHIPVDVQKMGVDKHKTRVVGENPGRRKDHGDPKDGTAGRSGRAGAVAHAGPGICERDRRGAGEIPLSGIRKNQPAGRTAKEGLHTNGRSGRLRRRTGEKRVRLDRGKLGKIR